MFHRKVSYWIKFIICYLENEEEEAEGSFASNDQDLDINFRQTDYSRLKELDISCNEFGPNNMKKFIEQLKGNNEEVGNLIQGFRKFDFGGNGTFYHLINHRYIWLHERTCRWRLQWSQNRWELQEVQKEEIFV